jgi:hypothetical protein
MKKLLLLDADVVIDLHSLGLFEKTKKAGPLRAAFRNHQFHCTQIAEPGPATQTRLCANKFR